MTLRKKLIGVYDLQFNCPTFYQYDNNHI